MKYLVCFALQVLMVLNASAQTEVFLPKATIKTLSGKNVDTETLSNDGKPIVLIFWATWCHHTIQGMDEISESFEDWQDDTGVKVIAVSTDDSRNLVKVAPMVNAKGWQYEFYTDANGDFQRQMNVISAPFVIVLDGSMNIVWQKQGFSPGDSETIFNQITKALENE